MKTEKLANGQIVVKHENLTLTQTIVSNTIKFNDCTIFNKENNTYELISQHDERLKPLFIALHNFKAKEKIK